jgi:hypothetical protein
VAHSISWAHADVFAASISVRVYLYVCVTDMGMDMHSCIMSAHTCDFKRENRNKQRERDTILLGSMPNVCTGELIGKSLYLESQSMCMIIACVFLCTRTKT